MRQIATVILLFCCLSSIVSKLAEMEGFDTNLVDDTEIDPSKVCGSTKQWQLWNFVRDDGRFNWVTSATSQIRTPSSTTNKTSHIARSFLQLPAQCYRHTSNFIEERNTAGKGTATAAIGSHLSLFKRDKIKDVISTFVCNVLGNICEWWWKTASDERENQSFHLVRHGKKVEFEKKNLSSLSTEIRGINANAGVTTTNVNLSFATPLSSSFTFTSVLLSLSCFFGDVSITKITISLTQHRVEHCSKVQISRNSLH